MKKLLLLVILATIATTVSAQKIYNLASPNGVNKVTVKISPKNVTYSVTHGNVIILQDCAIAMKLDGGVTLGVNASCNKSKINKVNQTIYSPFYKKSEIIDNYNELVLNFKGNYQIVFRAYNEGVAYHFVTDFKKDIIVEGELAEFNFMKDYTTLMPYPDARDQNFGTVLEKQYMSSFEAQYTTAKLSEAPDDKIAFLPVLIKYDKDIKAVITEADLEDYPGMYLIKNNSRNNSLKGHFATYPKSEVQGGHNMLQKIVTEREDFIAKTSGKRSFPWRLITISDYDYELTNNDMVYKLASPSRVEDISWIKPGKVAWDWWNCWNISGVPFKSGINNDTYKFYIDFASKNGIEYVILDEGWAVNKQADLFQIVPEINLQELVNYAKSKNVGIVLWAGYYAMDRDMEHVCKHYSEMGIKGFKVDFMDRDDQKIVDFYYRMAETAAKYHLFIDFHGAYKPTGLCRTYPNVLNCEGVWGLEQAKWIPGVEKYDLVNYEVTIPFIRQVAGYFDFTQGAMRNATKSNFRGVYSEPMSQGTRCRQLAEYVIFESPFNMLCDNPVNYTENQECTDFIAKIPTTWDETISLDGKLGDYVVIARRKGNDWYIGAINNWKPMDIEINTNVLGYFTKCEIFKDGANADKKASDYVKSTEKIINGKIYVHLAPGGGTAIRLSR